MRAAPSKASNLRSGYVSFCRFVFFSFLFLTMAFGRTFSIQHFSIGTLPVFPTEIVLFLTAPLFFFFYKEVKAIPRALWAAYFLFLFLGGIHFIGGMMQGNLFTLRDITLCGYPLFAFVTFFLVQKEKDFKRLFVLLATANVFLLIVVFFRLLSFTLPENVNRFLPDVKAIHAGMYFEIFLSYYIIVLPLVRRKAYRWGISILGILNLYFLLMLSVRSTWIAMVFLFAFLFFMDRGRRIEVLRWIFVFTVLTFLFFSSPVLRLEKVQAGGGDVFKKKCQSLVNIFYKEPVSSEKINDEILSGSENVAAMAGSAADSKLEALKKEFQPSPEAQVSPEIQAIPASQARPGGRKDGLQKRSNLLDGIFCFLDEYFSLRIKRTERFVNTSTNVYEERAYSSILWRFLVWRQTIMFGKESPFWGKGFGVYPSYQYPGGGYMTKIRSYGIDSEIIPVHNFLLTLFYKMGLIGAGFFIFIMASTFLAGATRAFHFRSEKAARVLIGTLGAFGCWHVLAFLFDVIESPPTSFLIWVLTGIVWRMVFGRPDLFADVENKGPGSPRECLSASRKSPQEER